MSVLSVVLPVFFMIGFGLLSWTKGWVRDDQLQGMTAILNTLLFPIMVFNAMFIADIQPSALGVIIFFLLLHLVALLIGKVFGKAIGGPYAHVSRFLMATIDGGNVCYPLYASLVGSQFIGNIVLMDIAGIFIIFLLIPILVSGHETQDWKSNSKKILQNPVVLAVILGLTSNILGLRSLLEVWQIDSLYSSVVTMATAPIVPLILFTIGYQFKMDRQLLFPLIKSLVSRLLFMVMGLILFLALFPTLRANHEFYLAALLYFISPPALVMPSLIQPVIRNPEDSSFVSAFTSLYMLVTLVVFVLLTFMV